MESFLVLMKIIIVLNLVVAIMILGRNYLKPILDKLEKQSAILNQPNDHRSDL